jgi:hypothetical protein
LENPRLWRKTINSSLPSSKSLFQSIQGILEFAYMGFFPMDHETFRIFNIKFFLHFTIEKGSLNIHLVKFPIKKSSKRDNDSNREKIFSYSVPSF